MLLASAALIVLMPLMALIAVCVMLESPGPPFYRAVRVGRHGRRMTVLKFRKMRLSARGLPLTVAGDERFTRVGSWLARTKLDELPQLLNVIFGQMSLVGPRPEDAHFVQRNPDAFRRILEVRPGITGFSQLAFAAESQILDRDDPIGHYERQILPQKLHLDLIYVSSFTLLLDLRILWWTVLTALLSIPVSVDRSSGRLRTRRGSGGRRRDDSAPVASARAVALGLQSVKVTELGLSRPAVAPTTNTVTSDRPAA